MYVYIITTYLEIVCQLLPYSPAEYPDYLNTTLEGLERTYEDLMTAQGLSLG